MVPRWLFFTIVSSACSFPAAAQTHTSPSTSEQTASTNSAEPMHFKVLESFVTSERSAKDGWADVGMLVDGHGRGTLTLPSGMSRLVSFRYTGCPGAVSASKEVSVPVDWKSKEEIVISVFLEGVLPTPVPQHGSCTLHLFREQ